MPLYDYRCDQCGHRFEVRQGIKEDPLTECPQCGGRIRRVIHPVGIVFKGSGFYVTDSRNKSSASSAAPKSEGERRRQGRQAKKEKASSGESSTPRIGRGERVRRSPSGTGSPRPAAALRRVRRR